MESGKYAIDKKIKSSKMKKYLLKISGILLAITACISFTATTNKTATGKGEWIKLFDGKTLKGWHGFNKTGTIIDRKSVV